MRASAGKRVLALLENDFYPRDSRVRLDAEALTAAGFHVTVICPATRGQKWRDVVAFAGVDVCLHPAPGPGNGVVSSLWDTVGETL